MIYVIYHLIYVICHLMSTRNRAFSLKPSLFLLTSSGAAGTADFCHSRLMRMEAFDVPSCEYGRGRQPTMGDSV